MSDIAKQIQDVATEAEATANEPMPADAVATRPNKPVDMAVRLTPEDAEAIEAAAGRTGIPTSVLLRTWISAGLATTRDAHPDPPGAG